MTKTFRGTAAFFLILAALGAAIVLFARPIAEHAASYALGREVEISGRFDVDYSLMPTLQASEVSVANAEWSSQREMLQAKAISLSINLPALLEGRFVLPELSVEQPVLHLEKSEQGAVNWDLSGSRKQAKEKQVDEKLSGAATQDPFRIPVVKNFSVNGGRIIYHDHSAGWKTTGTIDALHGQLTAEQPVRLDARGSLDGNAFTFEALAGSLQQLRAEKQAYPLNIQLVTNDMRMKVAGNIAAPMTLEGVDLKLHVGGDNFARLAPGKNDPILEQAYKVSGRLTSDRSTWTLDKIESSIGASSLTGGAMLDLSRSKPLIKADLKADRLNAQLIAAIADVALDQNADTDPKEKQAFDLSKLNAVNAEVSLHSNQINGAPVPLEEIVVQLSLLDGVLTVDPFLLGVEDGKIRAEVKLDASVPEPNGRIAAKFDDVPVSPLLDVFLEQAPIGGLVDGRFEIAFAADGIGTAQGIVRYMAPKKNTDITFKLDRVRSENEWLLQVRADGKFRGASANARYTGQPLTLLTDADAEIPISLSLALAKTRANAKGTVSDLGKNFSMEVFMSGPGTKRLARILSIDLPSIPQYRASAHVVRNTDTVRLQELQIRVGKSEVAGAAVLKDIFGMPVIALDLKAQSIAYSDFDQLLKKNDSEPSWLKRLDELDAKVEFSAQKIFAPENVVISDVKLYGAVKGGYVDLDSLRFGIGGGKVSMNADLNLDSDGDQISGLTGTIHANIEDVRLKEALKPIELGERFPGWLSADINLGLGQKNAMPKASNTIQYISPQQGSKLEFELSQTPEATRIRGKGKYLHEPFSLNGTFGRLGQLFKDGSFPLALDFKMLETQGKIRGSLREPLSLDGLQSTVEISGPNPRRTEPVVGFRLPELPPYRLKGKLARKKDMWRFTDFKGTVGDSDVSGRINVDYSKSKPYINANVRSKMLDLNDLAGIIGSAPASGPGETASLAQREKAAELRKQARVLPDEEFDFEALSKFNADIKYEADKVGAETLPIDDLKLSFSLHNGRMILQPVLIGAAGGVVKADIRLVEKPGERPVKGKLALDIQDLSLAKILDKYDIVEDSVGTISGSATFTTKGESIAKMLASLDGQASVSMAGGALDALLVELGGLDGGESFLLWLGNDQMVKVRCALIEATVRGGQVKVDTALVDTTDTKFLMEGNVNFDDETMALTIKARPKDFSLFVARTPFMIEGQFKDPTFHPVWGNLLARGAAALALASITPAAALLAFIEPGWGENAACRPLLD